MKTDRETRLLRNKYQREYRRKRKEVNKLVDIFKVNELNMKKEKIDKLLNFFVNDLKLNILLMVRDIDVIKYRILFNYYVVKEIGVSEKQLSLWYKDKGISIDRTSIFASVKRFKPLTETFPDINNLFLELKNINKTKSVNISLDKRDLTPLQKLIDDLPKHRELEIKELIELRIKSWDWKVKDNLKVYSGSY